MVNMLQQRWGDNLRQARLRAGLSQNALARAAEMEPSHITRAESGQANIGDERRIRIAIALGVRVEDIWSYPAELAS